MSDGKVKLAAWPDWLAILWLAMLISIDALVTPANLSLLLQKVPALNRLYDDLMPFLTRRDIY